MGKRAHVKFHSCEWWALEQRLLALTHNAPLAQVDSACARSFSHANGASCTGTRRLSKWSFANEHKQPLLMRPLLAQAELHVPAQVPAACGSGDLCASASVLHSGLKLHLREWRAFAPTTCTNGAVCACVCIPFTLPLRRGPATKWKCWGPLF